VQIRPVTPSDRRWVTQTVSGHFASARIVSRGVLHDSNELPGLVAIQEGTPCGVLLYAIRDAECEVVVLISLVRRTGSAAELLGAVRGIARDAGCRRLWLVTTNDNQPAIDFYSGRGWFLKAVHKGAVTEARRLKPEIPHLGRNGVPIRDEFEFELLLSNSGASHE
jgi:GNAT superfamily N-acetyltransferase